jgi:1,4-dihydroxy-2-naphthoyl-CoA hydrolase
MSDINWTLAVQQHMTGFDQLLGLQITEATASRVRATLRIADCHRQIHGVVHGGVYTTMVETLGSIGAALWAREYGRTIVGLDNHTSFLKAAREGNLHGVSEPLVSGQRTQVWQAKILDDGGSLVAVGQLRLLCIKDGSLPGATPPVQGSPFTPAITSR